MRRKKVGPIQTDQLFYLQWAHSKNLIIPTPVQTSGLILKQPAMENQLKETTVNVISKESRDGFEFKHPSPAILKKYNV